MSFTAQRWLAAFLIAIFLPLCAIAEGSPGSKGTSETEAHKVIVRITDAGLKPELVRLPKPDSSVFFFNESSERQVNVALRFGENRLHCFSSRLKMDDEGYLRTTTPLIPRSFVTACFPEPARYEVEVSDAASGDLLYRGEVDAR